MKKILMVLVSLVFWATGTVDGGKRIFDIYLNPYGGTITCEDLTGDGDEWLEGEFEKVQ